MWRYHGISAYNGFKECTSTKSYGWRGCIWPRRLFGNGPPKSLLWSGDTKNNALDTTWTWGYRIRTGTTSKFPQHANNDRDVHLFPKRWLLSVPRVDWEIVVTDVVAIRVRESLPFRIQESEPAFEGRRQVLSGSLRWMGIQRIQDEISTEMPHFPTGYHTGWYCWRVRKGDS